MDIMPIDYCDIAIHENDIMKLTLKQRDIRIKSLIDEILIYKEIIEKLEKSSVYCDIVHPADFKQTLAQT